MAHFRFDADYVARLAERDPATVDHFRSYFSDLIRAKIRLYISDDEIASAMTEDVLVRSLERIASEAASDPSKLSQHVYSVANEMLIGLSKRRLKALIRSGRGASSQYRVPATLAILWSPDVLSPVEYAELVRALAVIARAKGADGVARLRSVGVEVDFTRRNLPIVAVFSLTYMA